MAKVLVGTVASDKPDKTIIVSVQTRKTHPVYKKQYMVDKHFAAHDEKNEAKTGDLVSIVETRPLSASKKFKLDKILEKAALKEEEKEVLQAEEPQAKKESLTEEADVKKASKEDGK